MTSARETWRASAGLSAAASAQRPGTFTLPVHDEPQSFLPAPAYRRRRGTPVHVLSNHVEWFSDVVCSAEEGSRRYPESETAPSPITGFAPYPIGTTRLNKGHIDTKPATRLLYEAKRDQARENTRQSRKRNEISFFAPAARA